MCCQSVPLIFFEPCKMSCNTDLSLSFHILLHIMSQHDCKFNMHTCMSLYISTTCDSRKTEKWPTVGCDLSSVWFARQNETPANVGKCWKLWFALQWMDFCSRENQACCNTSLQARPVTQLFVTFQLCHSSWTICCCLSCWLWTVRGMLWWALLADRWFSYF